MRLSIIIPTLNEEKGITAMLENVAACAPDAEVIVVDGGSADATPELVAQWTAQRNSGETTEDTEEHGGKSGAGLTSPRNGGDPWRLLVSARGRGRQMNLGAAQATGDTLLFLHADTHLPPETVLLLEAALRDPKIVGGNFRIRFTPASPVADFYSVVYNVRSRFGLFYGDSALWVRRSAFEALGGYAQERLMEDFALVLRLRKAGKLTCLPAAVQSSARRFQGARRNTRALLQWGWLHVLLLLGAGDETLERFYPPVR
jgi:rSAM/selenodomain-associated transferase 2